MVQAATYGKVMLVTCAIGLGLSGYSFIVNTKKTEDPKYKSICDFNEHMSCSRVLTSEYAKGFGLIRHVLGEDSPLNVPNTVYGAAMFIVLGALSLLQKAWAAKIQIGIGVVANIFTVYFAFLLYFVLKDFCLLCVSTYVVNFINLLVAYLRLRALTPKQVGKQKGQQKSQKGQKKQQQQQNDKQKSPQAEKKKSEKQKSPQPEKQKQNQQKQNQNQNQNQNQQKQNQNQQKQSPNQKQNQNQKQSPNQKQNQNQQNGKVKNQQNDKQKSPKTPNSKKKNN